MAFEAGAPLPGIYTQKTVTDVVSHSRIKRARFPQHFYNHEKWEAIEILRNGLLNDAMPNPGASNCH